MNYKEPLLWEKGKGCSGIDLPTNRIRKYELDLSYIREEHNLPGFSEPVIARHFTKLSTWNYGVDTGIYPLGSCTMKYNPKINEELAGLFSGYHPEIDGSLSQGALEILYKTGEFLKEITGMDAVSLQPAAGAHGELVSIMMFRKYFKDKGEDRNIILIPDSAHGTNPASATLCGFKTRVVKSNEMGIITPEAVQEVIDNNVAGLMITNPNTLGVFETHIGEICKIVHENGGLVYADGANLNAIMGRVRLGDIGVDAMHLNLHKTFSTPHGGGGPGSGPVCVNEKLGKYLPVPRVVKLNGKYKLEEDFKDSIGRVHSYYGNFGVVVRAFCYILSNGGDGLKKVSELAVLNANYVRKSLEGFYNIPFKTDSMHEVLLNDEFQNEQGVVTMDIAKALADKGIHPPTVYFPLIVKAAMLVEPTECESLESLDHLVDTLRDISEIAKTNPQKLKDAPFATPRRRVDETLAARKPILKGTIPNGDENG